MSAYNYAAGFVAFSQGSSFEDISARLGIPLETLKTEARQHGWKKMTNSLAKPVQELTTLELSMADIQANRKKSMREADPLELLMNRTLEIYNRWWEELGVVEEHHRNCLVMLDNAQLRKQEQFTDEVKNQLKLVNEQMKSRPEDEELIALRTQLEAPLRALDDAIANEHTARENRDALRSLAAPSPKALAELAKAVATIQDIRYRAVGDLANKSTDQPHPKQVAAQIIVNMPGAIMQPREKRVHQVPAQALPDGTEASLV